MVDKKLYNIELLIQELGLNDLDEDQKSKLAELITDLIESRFMMFLDQELTKEELDDLDSIENADDQVEYIESKGINLAQVMLHITQETKEELLQDVAYIRGLMDAQQGPKEGPSQSSE